MYKNSPAHRSTRRYIASGVVALILLAGIFGVYVHGHRSQSKPVAATPTGANVTTGINYNPPTAQEKQAAEDNKQQAVNQMNAEKTTPPAGQKKDVTTTISSARQNDDQIEVYAYVSGITEDGGQCTYTFTQGSAKVVKQSVGVRDASTTICTPARFDKSDLNSNGAWTVNVNYTSDAATGSSVPQKFEVD